MIHTPNRLSQFHFPSFHLVTMLFKIQFGLFWGLLQLYHQLFLLTLSWETQTLLPKVQRLLVYIVLRNTAFKLVPTTN